MWMEGERMMLLEKSIRRGNERSEKVGRRWGEREGGGGGGRWKADRKRREIGGEADRPFQRQRGKDMQRDTGTQR